MSDHIINIKDDTLLKELKTQFQGWFPYLKLEFFKKSHGHGEGSPIKELLSDKLTVKEVRFKTGEDDIKVSRSMTVEALEDLFEESLGLHIQVFRKSGTIWLETSVTDKWTLERQNAHGAESELPLE